MTQVAINAKPTPTPATERKDNFMTCIFLCDDGKTGDQSGNGSTATDAASEVELSLVRSWMILFQLVNDYPVGNGFLGQVASQEFAENPDLRRIVQVQPAIAICKSIIAAMNRFGTRSALRPKASEGNDSRSPGRGRTMLVVTRWVGEEIVIGDNIRLTVVRVEGGKVRLEPPSALWI